MLLSHSGNTTLSGRQPQLCGVLFYTYPYSPRTDTSPDEMLSVVPSGY